MPNVQRASAGGATGGGSAVSALERGRGPSAEDTRGGLNQPNNHSKLTDSNNCPIFLLTGTLLLLLRLPSSLCLLLMTLPGWLSSLRDRGRMLNSSQKSMQLIWGVTVFSLA